MRTYTTKKLKDLRGPSGHIRTGLGTEDELRRLGENYLARPIHPLVVRACAEHPELFEVLDGNRRAAGVRLVAGDGAEVPVCVTDEDLTPAAALEIMMESALHTRPLSHYEQFAGGLAWLELTRRPAKELAARMGLDPGHLSKLLSLARCHPDWHAAARDQRVGLSDWCAASRLPEPEQLELLRLKLSGAIKNRNELRARAGRAPAGGAAAVRQARVVCPLAAGVRVVVTGPEMTLQGLIEHLARALDAARRASKDQLDVRTFERVLRDKAKGGAGGH